MAFWNRCLLSCLGPCLRPRACPWCPSRPGVLIFPAGPAKLVCHAAPSSEDCPDSNTGLTIETGHPDSSDMVDKLDKGHGWTGSTSYLSLRALRMSPCCTNSSHSLSCCLRLRCQGASQLEGTIAALLLQKTDYFHLFWRLRDTRTRSSLGNCVGELSKPAIHRLRQTGLMSIAILPNHGAAREVCPRHSPSRESTHGIDRTCNTVASGRPGYRIAALAFICVVDDRCGVVLLCTSF